MHEPDLNQVSGTCQMSARRPVSGELYYAAGQRLAAGMDGGSDPSRDHR